MQNSTRAGKRDDKLFIDVKKLTGSKLLDQILFIHRVICYRYDELEKARAMCLNSSSIAGGNDKDLRNTKQLDRLALASDLYREVDRLEVYLSSLKDKAVIEFKALKSCKMFKVMKLRYVLLEDFETIARNMLLRKSRAYGLEREARGILDGEEPEIKSKKVKKVVKI